MKAITLRQPWAMFVSMGWKTIETRFHQRFQCLKGQRIVIHSGKKFDISGFRYDYCPSKMRRFLQNYDIKNFAGRWYGGKIVCTAMVTDARWAPNVDFQEREQWNRKAICDVAGKFCLFLDDIRQIVNRIKVQGRQGIFNVPDNVIKKNEMF